MKTAALVLLLILLPIAVGMLGFQEAHSKWRAKQREEVDA